jgi:HlyD family secretion protein
MAEIELSQAETASAKANARAACLTAEVAQREANRLLKLKKSGAVSEETVDRAVTDASARRASCDAAKASTAVSASRVNVIRTRLDRTRLIAPFDGVVAAIHGELSEYVTPSSPSAGGTPVIDLLDTSCFHVTAPIDEVDAPRVSLGQTARVTLDAFGDREFAGTVSQIAPFVLDLASQARTVEIEVELDDPTDREELLAGYSADVEIILTSRNVPVRVPSEVVLENSRLFVLDGITIEERDVLVGISNWVWAEIIEGVKAGEAVVTSVDADGLENGALAEIQSEEE